MSTELAIRNDVITSLDDVRNVARLLAASNYFDAKGTQEAAIAQLATKVLAGREMGFAPFASVNGIHVIQGKPMVSANLMAAAVRNNPRYDYRVREHSDKVCRLEFFIRTDAGKWESLGLSDFTAEDAKRAQTKNMDKFPKNMLFARAMSNGVRWYCPDVFSGVAVYTPDELGADVDDNGDVIDVTPTPQPAPAPVAQPEPATENPFTLDLDLVSDRLEGNCAKFADWALGKHAQSNGPATRPQYEYLSGVIDAICGNDVHKDVLSVLVGRGVNSDNPPGIDLASALLDWLPETKGKGDAKIANPNHKPEYVACVRNIGNLVMEARGQATLGI